MSIISKRIAFFQWEGAAQYKFLLWQSKKMISILLAKCGFGEMWNKIRPEDVLNDNNINVQRTEKER